MRALAALALLAAAAALSAAQFPAPPAAKLEWKAKQVQAGAVLEGVLTLTFAEGIHGYANPPAVEGQIPVEVKLGDKRFALAKVAYPAGIKKVFAGEETSVYEGVVKVPIRLKVPAKAKTGSTKATLLVSFQLCDETSCFPPGQTEVSAPFAVVPAKKVRR